MHSSDLKKLITGFLILSALSGSLTLIFLNFTDKTPAVSSSDSTDAQTQSPLSIGKNAFVEQLPKNSFLPANSQAAANKKAIQAGGQTMDSASSPQADSSNLTQNFAGVFAQQVIAHNPDGPQTDANGQPTAMNLPNEDAATAMISQAVANTNFTIDEKVPDEDVRVLASYTSDDLKKYSDAMNSILGGFASDTKRVDAINQSSTDQIISLTGLSFETTYGKLKNVSVPQPFADTHRSVLQFFANQKKVFEIAGNYQADPLKTYIALKNDGQIVARDLQKLQDENNKIKKLSFLENGKKLSFLDTILGIQKAEAGAFGFSGDEAILTAILGETIAGWIKSAAEWATKRAEELWKWAYDTALAIAINTIIDQLQNKVVNWIAGNGDPKFITNWKGFLADTADKAIGNVLYKLDPRLCSNFGPLIRIAVLPVPGVNAIVNCTLTQVVQNIQGFYQNFQTGGWIAYGAALQPSGNFFGQLIQVNDIISSRISQDVKAAADQAISSGGFLSVRRCVKDHKENVPDEILGGTQSVTVCDQYGDTTPGSAVGHALFGSLDWKIGEFNAAKRFEQLVGAIINASINRMISSGLAALTATNNPSPTNYSGATPTGVSNPGSIDTLKSSVNGLVDSAQQSNLLQNIQIVASADIQWLALQPQAVTTLNQVALNCPILASSATSKAASLQSLRPTIENEIAVANNATPGSLKARVNNATSTEDLNAVTELVRGLNTGINGTSTTPAQDRLTALQTLNANAQANLPNKCNVPL